MTPQEYTPWMGKFHKNDQTLIGDYQSDYLNNATVRTALHIPSWVNQTWNMCSDKIYINYHLQDEASLWIYPILRYNNIRMVFYSGDTDGAVPTYGTKRWLQKLNWPLKDNGEWRAWHGKDTQVAGFQTNYDGLDFFTFRGVGHMAPQWAPEHGQTFITNWIHNIEQT